MRLAQYTAEAKTNSNISGFETDILTVFGGSCIWFVKPILGHPQQCSGVNRNLKSDFLIVTIWSVKEARD